MGANDTPARGQDAAMMVLEAKVPTKLYAAAGVYRSTILVHQANDALLVVRPTTMCGRNGTPIGRHLEAGETSAPPIPIYRGGRPVPHCGSHFMTIAGGDPADQARLPTGGARRCLWRCCSPDRR